MLQHRTTQHSIRQLTVAAMMGTLPVLASSQDAQTTSTSMTRQSNDTITADVAPELQPVAARDIPRGTTLTSADIAYSQPKTRIAHALPSSVATLNTVFTPASESDSLIGWTTRRKVVTGEALKAPAIMKPELVKAGELVELTWRHGSILVTTHGTAANAGHENDRVTVRLPALGSIQGSVIGAGRVRVDMR
ncbi:MAG: flagellar basal body P-ring formation chaperone FlgA [bacterium]